MSNLDLFGSDKVHVSSLKLYKVVMMENFLEDNISESFVFDDNVLKNTSYNEFKGFGLRAVTDELIGYSHSSDFSMNF